MRFPAGDYEPQYHPLGDGWRAHFPPGVEATVVNLRVLEGCNVYAFHRMIILVVNIARSEIDTLTKLTTN